MGSSWAQKMAKSSASGGGNYINRHGRYTLVVIECSGKIDDPEKGLKAGHKGESIAVRFRVEEASRNGLSGETGPHEVGDTVSTVFNFTKQPDMAPGKLKALVLALTGKKENEVTDEQLAAFGDQMISQGQPLVGKLVKCETFEFVSKANVKGVGQNWQFIVQDKASMAEKRASILGA